ncbi:hypothetical protein LEMLEM_LOCUS17047 [Lemmus lemmus]
MQAGERTGTAIQSTVQGCKQEKGQVQSTVQECIVRQSTPNIHKRPYTVARWRYSINEGS